MTLTEVGPEILEPVVGRPRSTASQVHPRCCFPIRRVSHVSLSSSAVLGVAVLLGDSLRKGASKELLDHAVDDI